MTLSPAFQRNFVGDWAYLPRYPVIKAMSGRVESAR